MVSYSVWQKKFTLDNFMLYIELKKMHNEISRIFEMRMLNMFIAEEALGSDAFLRGLMPVTGSRRLNCYFGAGKFR